MKRLALALLVALSAASAGASAGPVKKDFATDFFATQYLRGGS